MPGPAKCPCTWPGSFFFRGLTMPITRARVLRSVLLLACSCVGFGLFLLGIRIPFMFFLIALGVAWKNSRRFVGSGWSHGTARSPASAI